MELVVVIVSFLTLQFVINGSGFASNVTYTIRSVPNTTYIGSIPYTDDSFSYSSGDGNSISYSTVQYVPVIGNFYPDGMWVWMNNGNVPANAIIFQYINGYPMYYCRVQKGNHIYYGVLVPNKGCFLSNHPSMRFTLYQTLVR